MTLMGLHGLAEQTVEVEPYRTYELGPFEVSFTPSVHSKLLLGLAVPYDGDLTCEHLDGLSPGAYRCGQVWGISIAVAGLRFYHQGSANLIDDAVRERGVDVFLAGVAGRSFTDDYWQRILPRLEPARRRPHPLRQLLPPARPRLEFVSNVQLSELPDEIGAVSADIEVAALPRADLDGLRLGSSAWRRSARSCPSSASSRGRARPRAPSGRARIRDAAARQPVELAARDREAVVLVGQRQRLPRAAAPASSGSIATWSLPFDALDAPAANGSWAGDRPELLAVRRKTGTSKPSASARAASTLRRAPPPAPSAASKMTLPLARKVATSVEAERLEGGAQLLAVDPASAEVDPAQKGDIEAIGSRITSTRDEHRLHPAPARPPRPRGRRRRRPSTGCEIPVVALPSTPGGALDLAAAARGRRSSPTSIRAPACRASRCPTGWDDIPGARGCTPQSCAYRDAWRSSSASAPRWSASAPRAPRNRPSSPPASTSPSRCSATPAWRSPSARGLPTFEAGGMTLYRRLTMVAEAGRDRQGLLPRLPAGPRRRRGARLAGGPGSLMEAPESNSGPRPQCEGLYRFSRRFDSRLPGSAPAGTAGDKAL